MDQIQGHEGTVRRVELAEKKTGDPRDTIVALAFRYVASDKLRPIYRDAICRAVLVGCSQDRDQPFRCAGQHHFAGIAVNGERQDKLAKDRR